MLDLMTKQERINYEIDYLTVELKNNPTLTIERAWLDALLWVNSLNEEGNK